MKRIVLSLIFVLSLCCLVACGNNTTNNTESKKSSKDIGSRSNPYKVGDEINLKITNYRDTNEKYELTAKITAAYKEGEPGSSSPYHNTFYAARCEFSVAGDYDDGVRTMNMFEIGVLSEEMDSPNKSMILVSDSDSLNEIYTDVNYDVYLPAEEGIKYKYAYIKYRSQETGEFEKAYISLYD